ncbi:BCCT family transporter [Streptomyces sp. NPDC020792]|uniref:BCCT family transporter n=1 Tax=Streptomyces sp. NPDC020792 TaxID=3365089 RepID=UPI0037956295
MIANSGAMVMSNFSSSIPDPSQDGAKWLRIFWAVLTAVLTIAMLVAGGVTTMEYATLIFALPVTVFGAGRARGPGPAPAVDGGVRRPRARAHLAPAAGADALLPLEEQVAQFMERTVQPALADVVREFAKQGYQATLDLVPNEHTGVSSHALVVTIPEHRNFHYQVQAVEAPVPMFGGRMSRQTDVYYRVEVFTQTGSEGYDLMVLSHQQVIDDVLDRYEAHLGFLSYSAEHDYASVLTPPIVTATGAVSVV